MSNTFDWMSDDDVRQITLLVESLDRSSFDFLRVDVGDLKVTIGKGDASPGDGATLSVPAAAPAAAPAAEPRPPSAPPPAPAPAEAEDSPAPDGTVAIVAPMMGRFYAQPEPGAAPFVTLGGEVNADTTVGLIEVMKVFTAVPAGVGGVVTEVCVPDAELIEYGQALFRVRPHGTASDASPAAGPNPSSSEDTARCSGR